MERIPVDKYHLPGLDDEDITSAWKWFLSFISEAEWTKRKAAIESKISVPFKDGMPQANSSSETIVLAVKDDLIGWYLYLIDMIINQPHKYEFFQGARVLPIFKSLGMHLDTAKQIGGIEKRIKDLIRKRQSEADAILFEILTALLWARNGYKVSFIEEAKNGKTPDIGATKNGKTWNIECKRQSKTADYTYRETAKRQRMISKISFELLKRNILLDITFHVELEPLPDEFLKDLLEHKLPLAIPGRIISNDQIDIDLSFVDIDAINHYLESHSVKYGSAILNSLVGKKPIDNNAFTCSLYAQLFRVGEGDVNNLFVREVSYAYGVYWHCDAKEAIWAKARDIKNQVYSAMQQFNSNETGVIHIGMETFDGPAVEMARLEKINTTIAGIDPTSTNVKWIFCHFFQAYSPPDECWAFDETVRSLSPLSKQDCPLKNWYMIIPENSDTASDISHWERPLP